jgi:hypothetical protein
MDSVHIGKAIAINYTARRYEITAYLKFPESPQTKCSRHDHLLAKTLIDLITTIPQKSAIKL